MHKICHEKTLIRGHYHETQRLADSKFNSNLGQFSVFLQAFCCVHLLLPFLFSFLRNTSYGQTSGIFGKSKRHDL